MLGCISTMQPSPYIGTGWGKSRTDRHGGPALLIHHDGDESSQLTTTASSWPQVSIEGPGIHTLADIVCWSAQDVNSTSFNLAAEAGDDARLPLDCSRNPTRSDDGATMIRIPTSRTGSVSLTFIRDPS
jgi:hypothetical protein